LCNRSSRCDAVCPGFRVASGIHRAGQPVPATSFLPLRSFASIADLQDQADQWLDQVADRRRVRRIDAVVADAPAVERGWLRPPPAVWPDVDQRLEVCTSCDGFVRVGDVDCSVPPRFAGRRLGVRASLEQVAVFCDGEQRTIDRHVPPTPSPTARESARFGMCPKVACRRRPMEWAMQ
jgi:hypothetical protein